MLLVFTSALILGRNSQLFYWLHDYWEEGSDPRTRGYFLVDISGPMMGLILMGYILAVTLVIPLYMKNRKPYDLKNIIITYDILVVSKQIQKHKSPYYPAILYLSPHSRYLSMPTSVCTPCSTCRTCGTSQTRSTIPRRRQ